ncbi:MAG: hypothetical protein AB1810_05260 [Pseudomonadota bacterium]
MELKRIEEVREDEQGLIAEPFYALNQLEGARARHCRIIWLEEWWQHLTNQQVSRDWQAGERGWQHLRSLVESGALVLVFHKSYPPLCPAYRNVNGQWQLDESVKRYPYAQHRLTQHQRKLQQERLERERWAQNLQASARSAEAFHSESAIIKPPTLGPHVGREDVSDTTPEPVMVAGLGGALKGILQGAKKADSKPSALPPAHGIEALTAAQAKQRARQLDSADGGHSIARHGPDVSDDALKRRLTHGIAPDGKVSPAPASTRFNSDHEWLKTREAAEGELKDRLKIKSLTDPPKPGQKSRQEFFIDHGRPIDDGFRGVGKKVLTKTPNGNQIKVYSEIEPIEGLTKTQTTFKWTPNASNPAEGRWMMEQHFPDAKGWDQINRRYVDD